MQTLLWYNNDSIPGRHQAISWNKAEVLKIKNKIQWSLRVITKLIPRNAIVFFLNIIEHVKGSSSIKVTLSCLVFHFQISTSVSCAMVVVRISVLTQIAPIIAHVERASGCIQTNGDATVRLTFILFISALFFWSYLGIFSLSSETSHAQISWNLEAVISFVIMIVSLCCQDACQISEGSEMFKSEFGAFKTSQYLTTRRPSV